jgi:hypothetical protein
MAAGFLFSLVSWLTSGTALVAMSTAMLPVKIVAK